jgi:hypothetical protein
MIGDELEACVPFHLLLFLLPWVPRLTILFLLPALYLVITTVRALPASTLSSFVVQATGAKEPNGQQAKIWTVWK